MCDFFHYKIYDKILSVFLCKKTMKHPSKNITTVHSTYFLLVTKRVINKIGKLKTEN